ncbi:hypothetical protein CDAR_229401 [Caerostris darwini]|uniref:Uncharacterized protein n=1 Tax=Caerostris darwini TaxID=1538125 RepID=A0AAV4Q0K6_9ARAC|nr:hypothetical protein CDAR_229401 [Caerostris darwini]
MPVPVYARDGCQGDYRSHRCPQQTFNPKSRDPACLTFIPRRARGSRDRLLASTEMEWCKSSRGVSVFLADPLQFDWREHLRQETRFTN